MYIKQIIIEGFKTYKDQTAIDPFDPKHNVILGKNGSGKSNILAAIQFVLSDKFSNLRTEERQRLLHEGSGRDVMSASVEVIFDNSDNRIPIDQDTVSLKRVIGLKKDEYFLNNKHVTKAEVVNLLESAGLSRSNPYYIVEQGKVVSITKMSDTQRLELLKEIAGTRTYDERRKESMKIMQDTDTRRTSIQEVVTYIEQRLAELEGEKEELSEYQRLDSERRGLEYTIYDKELRSATDKLDAIENQRVENSERTGELHSAVSEAKEKRLDAEEEFKVIRTDIGKLESKQKLLQSDRNKCLKSRAKLELVVKDLRERAATDSQRRGDAEAELKVIAKKIAKAEADLETIKSNFEAKQSDERELRDRILFCGQRVSQLHAKQGRTSQFKNRKDRDAFLAKEIRQMQKTIASDQKKLAEVKDEIAELAEQQTEAEQSVQQITKRIQDLRTLIEESNGKIAELKKQRDEAANLRKELWRKENEISPGLSDKKTVFQKAEQQLQYAMPKDVSRGYQSVKRLAREHNLRGVHGQLVELFSCDAKFDKSVETTAAGSLFHVVVDTDETAAKLIELLNKDKGGRVTFMPLNVLSDREPTYPKSSDVFPMMDKLEFLPVFKRAMLQVFGRTLVCRNLDVASLFARNHNFNTITLDGDQVNKKGALTGGFIDQKHSRLEAQREIRAHEESYRQMQKEQDEVKTKLSEIEQRITHIIGEIQKENAARGHHHNQSESAQADLELATKARDRNQKLQVEMQKRTRALESDIEQLNQRVASLEEEMSTGLLEDLSEEEHEELSALTTEITEAKQKLMELAKTRSEVETQMKSLQSLLSDNLLKSQRELQNLLSSPATEEASEEVEKETDELRIATDTAEELNVQLSELEKHLDEKRQRLRELEANLDSLKQEETKAERRLVEESQSIEKMLSKRAGLMAKKDDCTRKIRDLGALPAGMDKFKDKTVPQLMQQLEKVNHKLKKFSHVNKKALDQYLNFTQERETLLKRLEEADAGRKSILDLIDHLDQKKDEAIQRTFKTIAKHFSTVFKELVPSGKGTLVIKTSKVDEKEDKEEDDMDVEEEEEADEDDEKSTKKKKAPAASVSTQHYTGVGIRFGFAKNRYQPVRSSSGGQMTVVALSLIFAIQRCDPSPFYLFDEIDSALDPTYRTAIAQMIHRQCADTQFITTTFRPEMLTTADKFYQVTFKNRVSRVNVIDREEAVRFVRKNAEEAAKAVEEEQD